MRRVLLNAFYFPPRNNIACYRSGCFAKFLPEFGWQPTVVCQDWPLDRPDSDPDFVGRLPECVDIHRIPMPPQRGFHQRVILRKLAPFVWPHRAPIVWWRQTRGRIKALLETTRYDIMWGTSDPLVPLTLTSEAAVSSGVPWVADIRDCLNVQHFGSWYKRPLWRGQERRLCRQANHVVTVSEGLADVLRRLSGRPVTVIPNGFDPTLLPDEAVEPEAKFRILYAGALVLPQQNPRPLFEAMERCVARGEIPRECLDMVFLGSDAARVERSSPGVTKRLPVRVLPKVPHKEALAMQRSAAVLLLLAHAHERGVMTGKVFDYLLAGRPILATPDDRETTAALLKRTGAGVALDKSEAIARRLAEWYAAWKSDRRFNLRRNEAEIAKYSRRNQAGTLAHLLDELAKPGSA